MLRVQEKVIVCRTMSVNLLFCRVRGVINQAVFMRLTRVGRYSRPFKVSSSIVLNFVNEFSLKLFLLNFKPQILYNVI